MKIPDSLHRCEDAVIMAQELIDALSNDDYTLDNLSWSKAGVRSLETFDDIKFTEEERIFFNKLLLDLDKHASNNWRSIPDGSWPGYTVNRLGQVRNPQGELLEAYRPHTMPDPTDDSEDSYRIEGSIVYKSELLEICFNDEHN